MKKLEKILWGVGVGILALCTFVVQQKEALNFLTLPSYIVDGAALIGMAIRFVYRFIKDRNTESGNV